MERKTDRPTLTISAKPDPTPTKEEPKKTEPKKQSNLKSRVASTLLALAMLGSVVLTADAITKAQEAQREELFTESVVAGKLNAFEDSPEFIQIAQQEVLSATSSFTSNTMLADNVNNLPNTTGIEKALEKVQAHEYVAEVLRNDNDNPLVPADKTAEYKLAVINEENAENASKNADVDAFLSLGVTAGLGTYLILKDKKGKKTKETKTPTKETPSSAEKEEMGD